jgi:hypothetical protein
MKSILLSSLILIFACVVHGAAVEAPAVEEAAVEMTPEEIEAAIAAMDGLVVERPDGTYMQIVLVESRFVFNFFDEKLNPVDPDVDRITVRISRRQPRQRTQLTVAVPTEGIRGLRAPLAIKGPYVFRANMSLMRDGIEDPVEFYVAIIPQDLTVDEPKKAFDSDGSSA